MLRREDQMPGLLAVKSASRGWRRFIGMILAQNSTCGTWMRKSYSRITDNTLNPKSENSDFNIRKFRKIYFPSF